ncbi:unnamed protein product [Arabidopsis arenosa]|uniref:aminobutyraldehyde dehydrogenase n=1 Tax=Arabidopsis arenosa TaxID=38785 RepID=A0A8S2B6Q1_ARAAE|nr:unnamed protein product [Arabidopsis arenosa]
MVMAASSASDMYDNNGKGNLFIDGEWREPILKNRIPIVNPATEELIGDIPAATTEVAVNAARRAFSRNKGKDWAKAPGAVRAKFLRAIAAKVNERKTDLAKLEALDCGKPLDEAVWDMDDVAGCFEFYADLAEGLDAKQKAPVSLPMESFKSYVLKQPLGVVGLITPWNYPLLMAVWKVAPSLAAGCTAILKPSELASVTCLELADICREVGLPPGVLNVLTGLGSKVMTAAAQLVKPVSMELGGKSPLIVFDDVDLDKAAEWALFGCFWTNGQICSATSRLLVHESIASEFIEKLVKWSKNIKISDPMEEGCRLGPVVSQGQYEKILKFISAAKSEGATILHGGSRPEKEFFGPVLCVKTFASEEEAIELANDSHYGLGAAVISNDTERCDRVSELGLSGLTARSHALTQAPWGGVKRSGFGRELGEWGLDNYLSVKQVTLYTSNDPWGWYKSPN